MTIARRPGGSSPEEAELARILSLPVEHLPDIEDVEIFCFENMRAEAFDAGQRLFPIQVAAVDAFRRHEGGLFPVGVGWGKTGICLMIAESAYQKGIKRTILFLPPQQVSGLVKRHIPQWRRMVPLSVPIHVLAGRSTAARKAIVDSKAPGLYVFPYSLLSVPDTLYMLESIQPGLCILDEVQNVKNDRAARTKRFLHLSRQEPPPLVVGMSGTITAKKIGDYHHLATLALRHNSPMPRSKSMAFFWGQVLDAQAEAPEGSAKKLMVPLIDWARENFPDEKFRTDQTESYRRAYRHRLVTAPGVVATGDEEIGTSLCIANNAPDKPGVQIPILMQQVDEGTTPQGEPIDHAIHGYKWKLELSAGFYNALKWPTPEEIEKHRKVGPNEAELLLEKAKIHLAHEQSYHKLLREFFHHSAPGLDTPREVGASIARYGNKFVGSEIAYAWQQMRDAKFEGMPERKRFPVYVDDFKIRHAVKWAKAHQERGAILWVYHTELGVWLVKNLIEAGVDAVHCPAGADDLIEDIGDPLRGGKGDRIVVASMSSHGTGRNLQAFEHQLFVQWPRSPIMAEQTLGRLHRNGQEAEELVAATNLVLDFDHVNRAATLNDALYIQQTTGSRQKVIYADYEPIPTIYSPEFLRENDARPEMLNSEQRQALESLFGPEAD